MSNATTCSLCRKIWLGHSKTYWWAIISTIVASLAVLALAFFMTLYYYYYPTNTNSDDDTIINRANCTITCPANCSGTVNGVCNHTTGNCHCFDGWSGIACNISKTDVPTCDGSITQCNDAIFINNQTACELYCPDYCYWDGYCKTINCNDCASITISTICDNDCTNCSWTNIYNVGDLFECVNLDCSNCFILESVSACENKCSNDCYYDHIQSICQDKMCLNCASINNKFECNTCADCKWNNKNAVCKIK